jgi:hypothetical protein
MTNMSKFPLKKVWINLIIDLVIQYKAVSL